MNRECQTRDRACLQRDNMAQHKLLTLSSSCPTQCFRSTVSARLQSPRLSHQCRRLDAFTTSVRRPGVLGASRRRQKSCCGVSAQAQSTAGKMRLIQHKEEAFWFYRFLSIVYDTIVNPGHWTEDMRTDALLVAELNSQDLKVRR